ncbi:hypothetical protein BGW80DRAFT_1461608 [Lactifluus volemus]|nr:hypothetical protein BGW80DRAFT_1461608 [Lactifluus volemus]
MPRFLIITASSPQSTFRIQLNPYSNRGSGDALACFSWHPPVRCLPPAFRYRFYHVNLPLLSWEFFTTLDFESSVIKGIHPYRWTIWIYSLMRIATLMEMILDIVELDIYTPINCLLWIIFQLIFSYFCVGLRITIVDAPRVSSSALAGGPEISYALVLASGIVRIRSGSVWIPEERCTLSNSDTTKLNAISTLATDSMLLMMLASLLHLRLQGGGMLSLGDFLWKQGLIWFLLAVVAEVPPTMFLKFKLLLTLIAIAATRIYRSLINFSSEMADRVPSSGRSFPRFSVLSGVISPTGMHVAIHTTREHDSMSQTNQLNTYICTEEQLHVNAWGLELGGGLESDVEKITSIAPV